MTELHICTAALELTPTCSQPQLSLFTTATTMYIVNKGCSVAEWLACWTQVQKGPGSNRSRDAVGNSLRQTVHTHCASVHQAAKLVAALLRVVGVTAGLAESNGSLLPGL